VRRSTLQLGAHGGEREKERDLQAKSIDRTVCFHIIYQETQFCGRSPRERVNYIYLIVLWDWCCVLLPSIILLLHHSVISEI
jgi:hypothetical protein